MILSVIWSGLFMYAAVQIQLEGATRVRNGPEFRHHLRGLQGRSPSMDYEPNDTRPSAYRNETKNDNVNDNDNDNEIDNDNDYKSSCWNCEKPAYQDHVTMPQDDSSSSTTSTSNSQPENRHPMGSSFLEEMVTPFFLVASLLFMLALFYSLLFLCILRFGTFVPEYNARYFRGRVYFCYGARPCFGLFGDCTFCYIPLCWCVRLHPLSEEDAFARALEGGGLSRQERRQALKELLKPYFETVQRSEAYQARQIDDEGDTAASLAVLVEENDQPKIITYQPVSASASVSASVATRNNIINPSTLQTQTVPTSPSIPIARPPPKNLFESNSDFESCNSGEEFIVFQQSLDEDEKYIFKSAELDLASFDDGEEIILFEQGSATEDPASLNGNNYSYNNYNCNYNNDTASITPLAEDTSVNGASAASQTTVCSLEFDSLCSICLCEYQHLDIVVCKPNICPHRFHDECLLEWLEVHNNTQCPCCRAHLVENEDVVEAFKRLQQQQQQQDQQQPSPRVSRMGKLLKWRIIARPPRRNAETLDRPDAETPTPQPDSDNSTYNSTAVLVGHSDHDISTRQMSDAAQMSTSSVSPTSTYTV